jgi:hypothetical protein
VFGCHSFRTRKYNDIFIEVDVELFLLSDATIIDDASVLFVELSIFRNAEGLPIMSILSDVTSARDSLPIIAAADTLELVIFSLLSLLMSSPPAPCVNDAPNTMTLLLWLTGCAIRNESLVFLVKLT